MASFFNLTLDTLAPQGVVVKSIMVLFIRQTRL